jgi:ABC-type lipoprotein release transport system permease subunit
MLTEEEAVTTMKTLGYSDSQIFWEFHSNDAIIIAFCLLGALSGILLACALH